MKRLVTIILLTVIQVVAYAQRGKVRPEWDINGGGSHHSIDDDLYSFLFVVGLVALFFIFLAIRGALSSSRDNTDYRRTESDHNSGNSEYCGEYVKMGYSSGVPIDNEEKPSKDDTSIINSQEDFNYNRWIETGKEYSLKDIWESEQPGLYDKINGNLAEVIAIDLAIDERILRIRIPLKDGKYKELKLRKTKLEEGDKVDISTIMGYEMKKKGYNPMIRYDGELFYSTQVSPVEIDIANKDSYGIKYSIDSKRLLYASPSIDSFSIRKDTLVICDKAFFMSKKIESVFIPNGIRKIGNSAFSFCPNLKFIDIPDSVVEIGNGAFDKCDDHLKIQIPNGRRRKFEKLLPEYKDRLTEKEVIENLDTKVIEEYKNTTPGDTLLEWSPVGDKFTLEEVCEATEMFNINDVDGEEAEITAVELSEDSISLRISIPFKDGSSIELKAGNTIQKGFEEGDKVKVNLIYGQELHKIGSPSIVRYDVWESEEEKRKYLDERGNL